ncbi:MAG: hypothetical protein ABIB98_01585 [bacterium]
MSENLKIVRGAVLMMVVYFGLLFLVNKVYPVFTSTAVIIGILIPSAMVGLAMGEKLKKKG